MITDAQKKALQDAGYTIEDMGKEHGDDFDGQYRWMNDRHEADGGDGFGVVQYDPEDAWEDALQFQEQALGIPVFVPTVDCMNGLHSWIDEPGMLAPDYPCKHCGELYGQVD